MSKNNLYHEDAKKKIKELAESIDFAMLATNLGNKPFDVAPMSTKKVDEDGAIWFLSGNNSDHNTNIHTDNNVQLIYSKSGDMEFLSIYGNAKITTDRAIIHGLYGKTDDMWFNGVDDPNLTAIKVMPIEAYYWDTNSNKIINLFKMGVAYLSGEQPDIGVEGTLRP